MDWVNSRMRRRDPTWKQGWTDNTLSIITFLLWFSQFSTIYRPNSFRYPSVVVSLHLFFILLPVIVVLGLAIYAGIARFNYVMRVVPLIQHEVDETLANWFGRNYA